VSGNTRDLVANRSRLGRSRKATLLWNVLRENGLVWTSLLALYYFSSGVAEASFGRLQTLKLKNKLPGTSSLGANKEIWENWDWQAGGEEWTHSPEWKESLIRNVLRRYIPPGGSILEIGPGGGRWTATLIEMADTFRAVDIAESCIRVCQQKFAGQSKASFFVGNGKDLSDIPDASIDSLWSFDVFVHINIAEAASYAREFRRVMRANSVGVVHHGTSGGLDGGWRSNITSEAFRELLQQAGFSVLSEFQTWEDGGQKYPVGLYKDQITVFGSTASDGDQSRKDFEVGGAARERLS